MEMPVNAPHKFERKKLPKNAKCYRCNKLIWSSGCSCSMCDLHVHKACAVKARGENCPKLERELSEALAAPSNSEQTLKIGGLRDKQGSSGSLTVHSFSSSRLSTQLPSPGESPVPNGGALEIFLSDGTSKTIQYQPDTILLTVINQMLEEKDIEIMHRDYIVYDRAGKMINNLDQPLKKVKSAFPLFFTIAESSTKSSIKKPLKGPKRVKYPQGRIGTSPDTRSGLNNSNFNTKNRTKSILGPRKSVKKGMSPFKELPESFEHRHGTMSIAVLSASDLSNQTSAYKFLYFTLTNIDNNQCKRSKLLENTATPTWNQTLKFKMPCAYGRWDIKIWAIRKTDSNSADVLLGEAGFTLKHFKDGDSETKTLVLRKEDPKKEKKGVKRMQLEFLQLENEQLRQDIEEERHQRELLREKLEEAEKVIAQQQDAHTEEMKLMKTKMQIEATVKTLPDPNVVVLLQEEIETLKKELQEARLSHQNAKVHEEDLTKRYEHEVEFYKALAEKNAEGGKGKNAKIIIKWAYQDRKLKTLSTALSQSSEEDGTKQRAEWTPSKSRNKTTRLEALAGIFRHQKQDDFLLEKDQSFSVLDSFHPTSGSGAEVGGPGGVVGVAVTSTVVTGEEKRSEKKKKIQEVYEFGEILGTGGSSVVREGVHKVTGQTVAIKILDNYDNVEDASDEEEAFWAEIEIIKQLDHPCILNVYDFYEDNEHYYVVLELLAGNELFDQIIEKGCYAEREAVPIIHQILLALEHLADRHICHLDLKPENILFTDETHNHIKLIDFGEASSCKDSKLTGWVGTNNYMAPEMIKHLEYDCKVDMWSLGVVTYIMLCGSFAFDAEDESDLYQDIMDMRYEFRSPEWDKVSEDAKEFVASLLTGPNERLSAKEALQHRWILSNLG